MVPNPDPSLDLDELEKIDSICAQFEKSWPDMRIEDALARGECSNQSELLQQLLLVEFELLRRNGQVFEPKEFVARFPDRQNIVNAAIAEAKDREFR